MICYRCGMDAGRNATCPHCGADVSVFQKAIRISNMYYNKGLQQAEVRDLSGAIASLKNSLKFNKRNIEARNLLGLVYYEMGEVVDALSEWVISLNYKNDNNLASKYLESIRENRSHLTSCNQTIKKYNQALLYCRQDSRDLAIIQLKKVLTLNPKLVKAHQLLALLYLQEDRLDQAKKSLRYAGKIDANNTTTLRYLKEVNTRLKEKGKDKKKGDDLISYQSGNETIIMPRRFQESSLGSTLAYVVIGLLVGVAVTAFLIVPGIQNKANQDASQKLVEASDTISSQAQMLTTLESQIADLEAQITELQNLSQQDPQELVSYEALINGYATNATGDIYTAGTYLEQVDTSHLSESALAIYTPIWESIYVAYYEQVYANAYAFYNAENFVEAIPLFVKLVEVDKGYKEGSVAYYLAQSYRRNGDMASARPYYQYVLDNYPNTEHARTAANYMKEE